MKNRDLLVLWIILPMLTSCVTTDNIRTLNTEVYGPGLLFGEHIDTVAIFNRDYNFNDFDTFYYKDVASNKMVMDSLVNYKELSITCTDALADYLALSGHFKAVFNYRDSMNHPVYAEAITHRLSRQNHSGYDAGIILDFIGLKDLLMTRSLDFDRAVIFNYPEFESSTMMETVESLLRWSIVYNDGSAPRNFRRVDNLFYGNSVDHGLFGSDENHRKLLKNSAGSLGESFAKELIPHWQPATRVYYRSHNPQMLTAQKYLLSENYRAAAEIYRRLTDNKNKNIAAKATYNMALICEVEGNLEAAIDWLSRSASKASKYDYHHFARCEEYVVLLKKRQKEIELLDKQL